MQSPGPRPAETRVSDDVSLCKRPRGASNLVCGWGIVLDVTSYLGAPSVDKETLCAALYRMRSDATRCVRDHHQSRSQTFHSSLRASEHTRRLDFRVCKIYISICDAYSDEQGIRSTIYIHQEPQGFPKMAARYRGQGWPRMEPLTLIRVHAARDTNFD
jgi:hypothetical protein